MRRAQAQMVFDRSRNSNLIGPLVALLIGWALWGYVDNRLVLAWAVAKCTVSAWRLFIIWRNDRERPARTLHWMRHYEAALFADGVLYGLPATLLLPQQPALLMMAMVATVIAIGAVGLVVLSMNQRASIAFTLPVVLPGALWQLASGEHATVYAGAGMLIFLALIVTEGRRASEHTRSMLRVQFRIDELAEQRQHALALAERSNAAKDQFLATMSHEVRTPLHGILGLVRLLQVDAGIRAPDDGAEARQRRAERLRTIEKSGEHLMTIINDVLDHSRIAGGQLRLYDQPFDLAALVREAVALQRGAAEEKHLTLTCRDPFEAAARWVRGDAARVRQILLNLLSNAVKFTPAGEVELTLACTAQGLTEIVVSDSGPGVLPADRERVFEPFEQLDGSFSRRHGGTGLGLAISRQLARAMRGDIECATSRQGGAAFRLWLHLPSCPAPVPAPPEPRAAEALRGEVLLVEDNAVNAVVAEASLHALGLRVTTVGDGQAAVAACDERSYDLVLMDCQLPGLDGFEAVRRIRRAEQRRAMPRVPIVALTANALAGDRERSLAAGMDDHFAKPFTHEELGALLRRHLAGR
ncbi:MAG: response regulator [Rubrivivax sp.]|nr:response regulator [Rubrivivax sp.]